MDAILSSLAHFHLRLMGSSLFGSPSGFSLVTKIESVIGHYVGQYYYYGTLFPRPLPFIEPYPFKMHS